MQKFPSEIASITKATKLTDDCFEFVQTKIQMGVTETELAWEIETFFEKMMHKMHSPNSGIRK